MYYLVLLILILFSGIELWLGKRSKIWFNISYLLMTLMAIFRYGQMDDYFGYYFNYKHPDIYMAIDPLFGVIISFFKYLSIGYPTFVALWSLACMLLSYRFFSKYCGHSCFSLLLFYCYTFMLCPMNTIRQGLCLALLLFLYSLLRENRNKLFILCAIAGCFIHLSFIAVIVLPFLLKIKIYNRRFMLYATFGFIALAFVGISVSAFLPIDRITVYEEGGGGSILLRMAMRIILIIPVLLFMPPEDSDGYYAKAICLIGFGIYCTLSFNDLVAGRLEYYFRTFICLFAAYILQNHLRTSRVLSQLTLILFVHIFLWFKNIDAGIDRMNYKEGITAFNFPYISVFNKSELKEYSGIYTYGLE